MSILMWISFILNALFTALFTALIIAANITENDEKESITLEHIVYGLYRNTKNGHCYIDWNNDGTLRYSIDPMSYIKNQAEWLLTNELKPKVDMKVNAIVKHYSILLGLNPNN